MNQTAAKVLENGGTAGIPLEQRACQEPVLQIKRILVPVDFSACSRKAVAYAVPFARQFGAELILLHVLQPYLPIAEMGPIDAETLEEAKTELNQLASNLAIPCSRALLRVGQPALEILDAAKSLEIDLLILSTHARSGLDHLLLGSNTQKVIRHAPCPVLVVREHEHDFVPGPGA